MQLHWPSEAATAHFARRLALQPALKDAHINLQGDLGTGKTTFVRHLLRQLKIDDNIKSPTYTIVESYESPSGTNIWHFDFYRMNDPEEWEDAGFREIFASPGLKLVEWPERAAGFLPMADLNLHLFMTAATEREVHLAARTACGVQLLP